MMRYAFFKGCKMPSFLKNYERATRFVLNKTGVELVDMDFNCCGNQVRDHDRLSFVFAAIRNLALAEKQNLVVMTPCKCCFGNLMSAHNAMKKDSMLEEEVKRLLGREGLEWKGKNRPLHLISILRHEIGEEEIKKHVVKDMSRLKVAAHYGCHALRPSEIMEFDNPLAPVIFEEIIRAAGAETVDWSRRLECCGSPVLEKNRNLSLKMMKAKLDDAAESGADIICTACSYCQLQFDDVRNGEDMAPDSPPSLTISQMLAEAFGMLQYA